MPKAVALVSSAIKVLRNLALAGGNYAPAGFKEFGEKAREEAPNVAVTTAANQVTASFGRGRKQAHPN